MERTAPATTLHKSLSRRCVETLAFVEPVYYSLVMVCVIACLASGVAGGYELHLSHQHPALRCITFVDPAMDQDMVLPSSLETNAPEPCKSPDEIGQPWRLKLVAISMIVFVLSGMTLRFARGMRYEHLAARNGRTA